MNYPNDFINKIICGDCSQIMQEIPENSIDLCCTDPPYNKKSLYTYSYLADYCSKILKTGSSLICIVGHYAIPQVLKYFDGKLKYRWLLHMNQMDGAHSRMAMGIEVTFKPMLWFVKDKYPRGRGFLRDGVKITGKDGQQKKLHKWQQDNQWCEYYIEKLTKPGDLVLDPFCGAGGVCVVAKKLGRRYIGIDIESEYCKTAEDRIKNV